MKHCFACSAVIASLLLSCAAATTKQGAPSLVSPVPSGHLRIVTWNVQNLFDTEWQGTEYPEYDPRPESKTAWGEAGFRYRIKTLATALDRLNADILALTEVESDAALRQLNLQLQRPFPYRLLLPQADQAVNIGLLTRISITRSLRHEVGFNSSSSKQLRAIIEVHLENELVLLLNHWKSQREGYYKTLVQRRKAAALLATRLRQLQQAYVLVLGDFNEPIDSPFRYSESSFGPDWFGLSNPWFAYDAVYRSAVYDQGLQAPVLQAELRQGVPGVLEQIGAPGQISQGSYYFRGQWQAIDSIFLSPRFTTGTWQFARFAVPRFASLLRADGRPNAWRRETMSGISDHLPLLLELRLD